VAALADTQPQILVVRSTRVPAAALTATPRSFVTFSRTVLSYWVSVDICSLFWTQPQVLVVRST